MDDFQATLANFTWPWAKTVRWWYFAEVFTGNLATIWVFWYFGWPAGVSGSKVM